LSVLCNKEYDDDDDDLTFTFTFYGASPDGWANHIVSTPTQHRLRAFGTRRRVLHSLIDGFMPMLSPTLLAAYIAYNG